jgi:hypothetical protein
LPVWRIFFASFAGTVEVDAFLLGQAIRAGS